MTRDGNLVKVEAAAASEVAARFHLGKRAQQFLSEGIGVREFLEVLVRNQEYSAAVEFVAHALPSREAVWWGCLCLQHACGDSLSQQDKGACKAAVQWVIAPTEENRAGARLPAGAAGPASPAGMLAAATFQSGGNIAPPNTPPVSPRPFETAKAVARAVIVASAKVTPLKIGDTQRLFVELGIGVAEGRFM